MRFDKDDPRLIDYALGELDEDERKAVEAALQEPENDEARQAVDEMQALAKVSTRVLQQEPAGALDDAQREAVVHKAERRSRTRRMRTGTFRRFAPRAFALSVLLAIVLLTVFTYPRIRETSGMRFNVGMNLDTTDQTPEVPASVFRPKPPATPPPLPEVEMHYLRLDKPKLESLGYLGRSARDSYQKEYVGDVGGARAEDYSWRGRPEPPSTGEAYARIVENAFLMVAHKPLSTFSIDVDTASYANVRRFLTRGSLPPRDAVRIEELINYFTYDYPQPENEHPFGVHIEMGPCPWEANHRLAKIGLKGEEVAREERPSGNFVFLLDVSGSMDSPNKLPLVKEAMKALLRELEARDRVGIVTYASNSKVHLTSTSCEEKAFIQQAIEELNAGGSTHGSAGIQDAYAMASKHFIEGGINRVILCTDGDFNVGVTSRDDLVRLIEKEAKCKVFLTALGFGMGNIKDATLEQLADKGNGNYAYIDSFSEARRVLVEQLTGTLITIAKDVKIQVEFNPGRVSAYRLLGYENRMLAARDFNDDTKDAGEIGAGHTVTALYEIVPVGFWPESGVDDLKYQPAPEAQEPQGDHPDEWMTVKLRYKLPEGDTSTKLEAPVREPGGTLEESTADFRQAAAVAAFGLLLRDSKHKGEATWDMVIDLANSAKGADAERQAFADLAVTAKTLAAR